MRGRFRRVGWWGRFNRRVGTVPPRFIAGADKPEKKFYDTEDNGNFISSAGSMVPSIIEVAEGPGPSQRIGRRITLKSVQARIEMYLPAHSGTFSAATNAHAVRFICYLDRQTNGGTAVPADILYSPTNHLAAFNLENKGRFRILVDRIITFHPFAITHDGDAAYGRAAVRKYLTFYKKLNVPQRYDASTGSINNIMDYNIGFLLIANSDNVIGWDVYTRVRYTDS